MASINIRELFEDSVDGGVVAVDSNIVIPVLVDASKAAGLDIMEFTNADTFTSYYEGVVITNKNGSSRFIIKDDDEGVVFESCSPDLSHIMALQLLSLGATVVAVPAIVEADDYTKLTGVSGAWQVVEYNRAVELMSKALVGKFGELLRDKFSYQFRFITSGGYPNVGVVNTLSTMASIAVERGDCVALAELPEDIEDISTYDFGQIALGDEAKAHTQGYFPAVRVTLNVPDGSTPLTPETSIMLPACFSYLSNFLTSTANKGSWFAISGITRGVVGAGTDSSKLAYRLTPAEAKWLRGEGDNKPALAINPIVKLRNYGSIIDGNRTAITTNGISFINFANVRQLICDIKKQIFQAGLTVMYEPNDDISWLNFTHSVNDKLDKMRDGRGISQYFWVRDINAAKGTLAAKLTIVPVEAIENIEIDLVITDSDLVVEEAQ